MPPAQPRKQKVRQPSAKTEAARKETSAKPQGPLIIAISIEQQKVRVYDANGLFAESPVSTGMKGHSTPMGVFSVIQKNKMHRSNIYSGAPMPYMQRITWSGIALHAGVLPGYPASHGCIRMPMAFAVKMWNWTRMGARVIITPGADHARQFLASVAGGAEGRAATRSLPTIRKTDAPAVKSDKGADAGAATKPANSRSEPRTPIDRRSRGAVARTDPHRGCQRRACRRRTPCVRCNAVRSQGSSLPRYANAEAKADAPKSEPAASEPMQSRQPERRPPMRRKSKPRKQSRKRNPR